MALVGLSGIEFVCPECGGRLWRVLAGGVHAACETGRGCTFTWNRKHDFRVFFERESGAGFASPEALELAIAPPRRMRVPGRVYVPSPVDLAARLAELLAIVMIRAPSAALIESWTRDEQRAALRWAGREILIDADVNTERLPRPAFLKDRAA